MYVIVREGCSFRIVKLRYKRWTAVYIYSKCVWLQIKIRAFVCLFAMRGQRWKMKGGQEKKDKVYVDGIKRSKERSCMNTPSRFQVEKHTQHRSLFLGLGE